MHWLKEWRLYHGASREQLAERCAPCTAAVIARIEDGWGHGVTHPNFAKRICDYVGASAEQWNSIVPEKYRGSYVPVKRGKIEPFAPVQAKEPEKPREPERPREPYKPKSISLRGRNRSKEVLQIGTDGEVMKRYPSIVAASSAVGKDVMFVSDRLHGKRRGNEFMPMGFTYRFAHDWNDRVKARLMPAAKEAAQLVACGVQSSGRRYLTIDGETRSLQKWAKIAGTSPGKIRYRLDKKRMSPKEAVFTPPLRKGRKGGEKLGNGH